MMQGAVQRQPLQSWNEWITPVALHGDIMADIGLYDSEQISLSRQDVDYHFLLKTRYVSHYPSYQVAHHITVNNPI